VVLGEGFGTHITMVEANPLLSGTGCSMPVNCRDQPLVATVESFDCEATIGVEDEVFLSPGRLESCGRG
jgi:hypothetical protein